MCKPKDPQSSEVRRCSITTITNTNTRSLTRNQPESILTNTKTYWQTNILGGQSEASNLNLENLPQKIHLGSRMTSSAAKHPVKDYQKASAMHQLSEHSALIKNFLLWNRDQREEEVERPEYLVWSSRLGPTLQCPVPYLL